MIPVLDTAKLAIGAVLIAGATAGYFWFHHEVYQSGYTAGQADEHAKREDDRQTWQKAANEREAQRVAEEARRNAAQKDIEHEADKSQVMVGQNRVAADGVARRLRDTELAALASNCGRSAVDSGVAPGSSPAPSPGSVRDDVLGGIVAAQDDVDAASTDIAEYADRERVALRACVSAYRSLATAANPGQ